MEITRFTNEHRFLSNFYMCPLLVSGIQWPSAEHAFQGLKSTDPAARQRIAGLTAAGDAKRAGRMLDLRPDWGRVRKQVMLAVVLSKFIQNPGLAGQLTATGDQLLLEGNHWHDNYWGSCWCVKCSPVEDQWQKTGQNYLGRILMAVRDVIRVD